MIEGSALRQFMQFVHRLSVLLIEAQVDVVIPIIKRCQRSVWRDGARIG